MTARGKEGLWVVRFEDDSGSPPYETRLRVASVNEALTWVKHKYGGGSLGARDPETRARAKATKATITIERVSG